MSTAGPPAGYGYDPPGAGPEPRGLQWTEAYNYVFASPRWGLNLLLGGVCQLIPIVGPIALLGYEFEIVEALHRNPARTYPDFDFGRFVNYLSRGVWPFLVALIVAAILVPLVWMLMAVMIFGIAAAGNQDSVGLVVLFVLLFVTVLLLSVAMNVLMLPLILRAGLAQDFAAAFRMAFFVDFIRRMWLDMLLASIFMMVTGLVVGIVGLLLCFIGVYPAATLVMLAQTHLHYQLYQLYLARGGEVIALKEPAA